jgi:hypothetical protein
MMFFKHPVTPGSSQARSVSFSEFCLIAFSVKQKGIGSGQTKEDHHVRGPNLGRDGFERQEPQLASSGNRNRISVFSEKIQQIYHDSAQQPKSENSSQEIVIKKTKFTA